MDKLERMQKEMLARMEQKRRNKNNWPGAVMTNKTPTDIADWQEIIYGGNGYKPLNKMNKTGRK